MRKFINNRRYDTSKARRIASVETGAPDDLGYIRETLYQKKRTGEKFLHGSGGSASRYAEETAPGEWAPGEKIIPLSDAAARDWVKSNCDRATWDRIYTDPGTYKADKVAGFLLSDATRERVREYAEARGWSQSAAVEYIINSFIDLQEGKNENL
jgi:hypothetical protein